ncbi:CRASP family complement regulator-acquiring lipoprotein [Borreliella andersonii]|uniref:CRASP family complement regulator-acquiring lipoprotein n=1 Tax=Borrelia andersonii TaxID=42109 RepID=A0ACD5G610_BORAD
MQNKIILCIICVFSLLNSCNSDHNTKAAVKQHTDKITSEYADEIKKLIATTKKSKPLRAKPEDQKPVNSKNGKVFEIDKRAFDFINSFLTDDELDEFTTIFHKPQLKSPGKVLNSIAILEMHLAWVIKDLDSKKDTLDKTSTSDLKKIKNSLEQLFSIRKFFSTNIKQILLDHQNNKNSIKSEDSKLEEYLGMKLNQFNEKNKEVRYLKETILSVPILAKNRGLK